MKNNQSALFHERARSIPKEMWSRSEADTMVVTALISSRTSDIGQVDELVIMHCQGEPKNSYPCENSRTRLLHKWRSHPWTVKYTLSSRPRWTNPWTEDDLSTQLINRPSFEVIWMLLYDRMHNLFHRRRLPDPGGGGNNGMDPPVDTVLEDEPRRLLLDFSPGLFLPGIEIENVWPSFKE